MEIRKLIAGLLRQKLEDGESVEIEGLGTFLPGEGTEFHFIPRSKPRVFIGYAVEDYKYAYKLYGRFEREGFDPWLDKKKLLPGQNWPRAIEAAIRTADFFVACFSHQSVSKRGGFQCELRFALECAASVPLDEIFLIPVRLEACRVPSGISRRLQYVDLFPQWEAGATEVVRTLSQQHESRKARLLLNR